MASTERQNNLLVAEDWTKIYQTFQNADFKSYDFETIRRTMIDYLRQNYPENFNDYIDSSEYIALIDVIAFLAQSISFRIDLNARENFIDTAQRRDSILKLAKLISYNPKRCQSANGLLKIVSVSTSENLVDSNGTNLSNKVIVWNDGTNPDWYQQFTYVMNSAMKNTIFGNPNAKRTIAGVPNEQYDLSVVSSDVPVFAFSKTVSSVPMNFEIVGSTIANRTTVGEQDPAIGGTFGVIYKNDNRGSASKNSGWFVQFKEGNLQSSDFTVTNPMSNEVIGVDVPNINNTDVWLFELDANNNLSTMWTKLDSVGGTNVAYNSLKNKTKHIYSVSTRENDQIDLNFGDGVFGKLPSGNFRLYYRTSNGLSYVISPQDMSNIQVRMPYLNANGQTQSLTMVLSLQSTVSNSASTESNDSIKKNAPQLYYTQNRMITGEDYNVLPVTLNQDIVKVKAINRVASGISRYFDINDPTGRTSSVSMFAEDGCIYQDTYTTNFTFSFNTKNEVYGIVKSKIEPLIATQAIRDFYYEEFDRILTGDTNIVWQNVSVTSNQATGYFKDSITTLAVPVGQFTQSPLRYVKSQALVKFVPPTGKYFAPNNTLTSTKTKNTKEYLWSEIVYVSNDGSNSGKGVDTNGVGMVSIATPVPNGAIPSEIIPLIVTDIPFTFETEIVNQISLRRDFGIRYDRDASEWKIVNSSNLNLENEFSLTYSGDVSNLRLDSSWLIAFKSDGDNYIAYYRGLDYIFQSKNQVSFYFNEQDKRYSSKLGGTAKDTVSVLSINEQLSTGYPLAKDFVFEITGMILDHDGYYDNNRVKVSFADKTGDGIVDDPDSFKNIVEPLLVDPDTNTRRSFVFVKTTVLNDQVYTEIVDSNLILTFNSELDILDFDSYDDGQLFYFYSPTEDIVKRLDKQSGLILEDGIKAYVGRSDIKFHYVHTAGENHRIDPCKTNIIDIFLLSKSYDDELRAWVTSQSGAAPTPPDSIQLYEIFSSTLNTVKSISDEIIFHPAKYKLLFGNGADPALQAKFYIVKNSNSTVNDNDIKSRVITAMNQYFALDNWDFGDTFNFGELSAYVIKELSPDVVNFLIVPTAPEKYFGSLFQVFCQPDEIFLSTASVNDLSIIQTVTAGLLKTNGPIVVSTS